MSNSPEEYIASQTQLPVEQVTEIVRAGIPWPIVFDELEQQAERDAQALGVPLETARKALDQLCDIEGASLVALTEQAKQAAQEVPSLDLPEMHAILNHPLIRDMMYYSQRVALRVGETCLLKVLIVHLGILAYAWEHPDWDQEEPVGGAWPA